MHERTLRNSCATALLMAVVGCGGDARVELSAADTIRSAADQMTTAVNEYHGEVTRGDDAREADLIAAFVARVLAADPEDHDAIDQHTQQFKNALAKVRTDRNVEWQRLAATRDNIDVLHEVADGLQQMGINSLTLQDEMKRYLDSWMTARTRAQSAATSQGAAQ